jgi:hypothetical protein
MRRWLILACLGLAQLAIVVCYLQIQTASPSTATAEQPAATHDDKAPPPQADVPLARADKPAAVGLYPVDEASEVNSAKDSTPPPPALGEQPPASGWNGLPTPQAAQPPASPEVPVNPSATTKPDAPTPPPAGQPNSPLPQVQPAQPAGPPPAPGNASPPPLSEPPAPPPTPQAPVDPTTPPRSQPIPPPASHASPVSCPWTFNVVVVDGRTILTAKIGEEVQFKVTCDALNMTAPTGAVQASGAIKVTSPGLDGSGERLIINLQENWLYLEGQARLRNQRDGQEVELQADRLRLRIVDGKLSNKATVVPTIINY